MYNSSLSTVEEFALPTSSSPINLIATASNSNITLNWDAVQGADSYAILRSTTSSSVDTVIASNITGTTYIDNDVEPGVTYYYVVRAVKDGVESDDSNIAPYTDVNEFIIHDKIVWFKVKEYLK